MTNELDLNIEQLRHDFLVTAAETKDNHLNIAAGASGVGGCQLQQYLRLSGEEIAPSRELRDIGEDFFAARAGNALEPVVDEVMKRMGLVVKDAQCSWAILNCGTKLVRKGKNEAVTDTKLGHAIIAHNKKKRRNYIACDDDIISPEEHPPCYPVVTGHPDGIIVDGLGPYLPGGFGAFKWLFELKFMGFRRYIDLVNAGVQAYGEDQLYYLQAQLNMGALDCTHCLFLAMSKDKSAVKWGKRQFKLEGDPFTYFEVVQYDEDAYQEALERAGTVVDAATATQQDANHPGRRRAYDPTGGPKADWHCRWCDWHLTCLTLLERAPVG